MPIFHFESRENKLKKAIKKFANEIAHEAAKNFNYDPDSDPVLADFRKKLGLPVGGTKWRPKKK